MAEIWLTPDEYKKRQERLENMKGAERLKIAEMLKEARAQGDLSENAEYDAAKDLQAKLEYDIVQLDEELKNAKVIDEETIDRTIINVGTTVSLSMKMPGDKKPSDKVFRIVGSAETDPANGLISNESPIGKALLGHKPGDVVEVSTPMGIIELVIEGIGM